jgi:molecular chaperone GrpE
MRPLRHRQEIEMTEEIGDEVRLRPGLDDAVDESVEEPLSEVESLKQQLQSAREEAAANEDRFLRARADMENFRKRIERNAAESTKEIRKGLLLKMLSVRDNLERAIQFGGSGSAPGESLMEGVRLTSYQLDQVLESEGVRPIETVGEPFNPHLAEAVHRVSDPNVPDGTVVQEARRGYVFGDDVLRPAQVVVSVHDSSEQ